MGQGKLPSVSERSHKVWCVCSAAFVAVRKGIVASGSRPSPTRWSNRARSIRLLRQVKLFRQAQHGCIIDATSTMYPSRLVVHERPDAIGQVSSTTYGYVLRGSLALSVSGFQLALTEGAYFAAPGKCSLAQVDGTVVAIERHGFLGMLNVGAIEQTGRLAYIDGCSDSVLCMPPRRGDPVLNHLHFPAGTTQSLHSHPSIRLGVIARGTGVAFGRTGAASWEQPLGVGDVFLLAPHELHAFKTTDTSMDVIAYHPDSDWGPTDAEHPMLNRTFLAGR
jgi:hypothetical protein